MEHRPRITRRDATQPAVMESLRVAAAPFEGRLYWLVTRRDGEIARIDALDTPHR